MYVSQLKGYNSQDDEELHILPYRKNTKVIVCHSKRGTRLLRNTLVWFLKKESMKNLRNIELISTDLRIK
jgi:hypothetical protein